MQGMVVVGLIVEELSNINVKCVKYRSRSPGQGTCQASAMRWSTMQGLVVVGLIFEEIPNINIKCVEVTGVHNIGQGHQVKVTRSRYMLSQYIEKKCYIRFGGWRPYSWWHMKGWLKRCKSQWSAKYRSRSTSEGNCWVRTLRRSTMQGLMVVGLTVEEILNVDVKCVKGTGPQNIGQGHWVKIPAESVHLGEALCKVWWLEVLHLRRSGTLT